MASIAGKKHRVLLLGSLRRRRDEVLPVKVLGALEIAISIVLHSSEVADDEAAHEDDGAGGVTAGAVDEGGEQGDEGAETVRVKDDGVGGDLALLGDGVGDEAKSIALVGVGGGSGVDELRDVVCWSTSSRLSRSHFGLCRHFSSVIPKNRQWER